MTILKLNLKALRSLSMYSVKFIATSRCPNHIYVYQQNLYALVVEAHLKLSIKGNVMKQTLSRMKAELLALFYYNYELKYSHINSKGEWEFAIGEWDYFGDMLETKYKTKGYK